MQYMYLLVALRVFKVNFLKVMTYPMKMRKGLDSFPIIKVYLWKWWEK